MSVRITALTDPAGDPSSYRLAWLASDTDGIPVGSAFLRLFTRTGQEHLAELDLRVHPADAASSSKPRPAPPATGSCPPGVSAGC
jgi:hypothetical protein